MSTDLAVSMDELEQESAELLPGRETMNVCSKGHFSSSFTSIFTGQVAGGGDTYSSGLISIPVLNGNAVNVSVLSF